VAGAKAPLVSWPLNVVVEVLVRALGLIPVMKDGASKPADLPHRLLRRNLGIVALVLLTSSVLMAYGALIVMDFHSKRSSLGAHILFSSTLGLSLP